MKKLLLIILLIVGCAPKPVKPIMIIDGNINTNSTTFTTDGINDECKKECKTSIVSTDEWCDCMYKCIRNVINNNLLDSKDEHLIISVEGYSIDDFKKKLLRWGKLQ